MVLGQLPTRPYGGPQGPEGRGFGTLGVASGLVTRLVGLRSTFSGEHSTPGPPGV